MTAGLGVTVELMERSIFGALTVVKVPALLFAWLGSLSLAETRTLFATRPGATALAIRLTVALAPADRLPRTDVIFFPFWLLVPWLETTETKFRLKGRSSTRVTPVASSGPRFVTTAV